MLTSLQSSRIKSKIKWLDNGLEENKDKLITNDEKLDLLHKDENTVQKVDNHKK